MGLGLEHHAGETPLEEEEKEGLLIDTIATREELNEFEQKNIENALEWMFNRSFTREKIFSEKFVCELHKRMFGDVWQWAGKIRKTEKNLGIASWEIPVALKNLCADAMVWSESSVYSPDEIALRFKHRIVSIHCFPNGNGRHSRLMADIIISKVFKQELFSWGESSTTSAQTQREQYLEAVKAADLGDFKPLLKFARS